jgi:hypothetical protein
MRVRCSVSGLYGGRVPEAEPVKYRSSVAAFGNVVGVLFGGLLVVSSLVIISERLRNLQSDHLGAVGTVVATVVFWGMAAAMFRMSRTALEVSASSVRVVNWFRTYEFKRSGGLTLVYGNHLRDVGLELALLAGNDRHVVLCASDGRKVNVAALTLGNTRMGVDDLRLMVAKLNAAFAAQ